MKFDYDSRNWRDAKCTITWTPQQVYGDNLETILEGKAAYNLEVKSPGEILEPYECPFCGYCHIGHTMDPVIIVSYRIQE